MSRVRWISQVYTRKTCSLARWDHCCRDLCRVHAEPPDMFEGCAAKEQRVGRKRERRGRDKMPPCSTLLLATGSLYTIAIHSTSFSAKMWEQSDCQAIMNKTKRLSLYKSVRTPFLLLRAKGLRPGPAGSSHVP